MERNQSGRSTSSRGSSRREIEEESPVETPQRIKEEEELGQVEKVYVAVKKELKEGKSTLLWLLQNIDKERRKIVITHVHIPAQLIPFMGSKFPASKVKEQVVREYRLHEREKMHKSLDEYMSVCADLKVRAEKLVIEADSEAKGIIELIALHGIAKLVMGSAADKHFSRKMKTLKSKTAITVNKEANSSCNIWFICKGHLICTREASLDTTVGTSSTTSTLSSVSGQSLSQAQSDLSMSDADSVRDDLSSHASRSNSISSNGEGNVAAFPNAISVGTTFPRSRLDTEMSLGSDTRFMIPRSFQSISHSRDDSFHSTEDQMISNPNALSVPKFAESEEVSASAMLQLVHESVEDLHFSSPQYELEEGLDTEIYDRLLEAHKEVEKLRLEAYKESLKCQKAETSAVEALRKAKTSENMYATEVNKRKEVEEELAKEKLEVEMLKKQCDQIFEQLRMSNMQKLELELQVATSGDIVRDLEEKLLATQHLLSTLQVEHEELKLQRDAAVEEIKHLRQVELITASSRWSSNFSEFSFSEIKQATCSFSNSLKIGEGGYGSVYKGFLRNTTVAIKMLDPESLQGQLEFQQEIDVLSRVRHPNLVTLMGVCSEARALIYEFLPSGSLEDRLGCKENSAPLTWQVRTRIAVEICNALIFLHSDKPHPVVHGDLNPANILLDANLMCKLGDFGICRILKQSTTCNTTLYHQTHPKGTFAYIDPEFLATGELTPSSDVYSFGLIILQLLTGKPSLGIVKEVKEALSKGLLHELLDPTAGDWPFVQARQLAHLGLRCCEISRKNRPDLGGEVWRVLEPLLKTTSFTVPTLSFGSYMDDNIPVPSYFVCPILQEVMRDPHIAADGFTYEAEALKGWVDSGHDTSPMTNLTLPNCDLIPNHALRSAIQEWLQHHHQI